jgi:hypothetical protein
MAMQITDTMRQAWARDPVTQEHLRNLHASKQETMELWAREGYIGETGEVTLQANAKALGGVAALNQLIDGIEGLLESEEHNMEGQAQ